jgi:hypothetical protein
MLHMAQCMHGRHANQDSDECPSADPKHHRRNDTKKEHPEVDSHGASHHGAIDAKSGNEASHTDRYGAGGLHATGRAIKRARDMQSLGQDGESFRAKGPAP